jgi:hypothetical protein
MALTLVGGWLIGGCGESYNDYPDTGDLYISNRTDLSTNENVVAFRMAADGYPLGNQLLPGPILPTDVDYIITLWNGIYDGECEMELGGFVDFFDWYAGSGAVTVLGVL